MAFHAYLNFDGNCREAFTRYQEVFGGELVLLPMSDLPGDEQAPAEQADLIMHGALTIGDQLLMASDVPPSDDGFAVKGMYVSYSTAEVDDAKRVFEALAEGGEIEMPIGETFWSPMFGVCVDRFGTPWMIGADAPEQSS